MVFLSSGDGYFGELLQLHPGCQGPFRGSRGKVEFLSRGSGKGPILAFRGESPGFIRVAPRNIGFLSIYEGDIRVQLKLTQERSISIQVVGGLSGLLPSHCQGHGPHLELRPEPQSSSPVLTWNSGFLSSFHRAVRPRLMWRHASWICSRAGKAIFSFLSS